MSLGNFSNGGVDTFDERKHYIGVRLQQGVPLLDRDWNELEDIRRHFEQRLRALNVGMGVPDDAGFLIAPAAGTVDNDVVIAAGNCSVAGFDVRNDSDVLFSAQGDLKPLPPPDDARDQTVVLYLEPTVVRVDATFDPALGNPGDVHLETCLRDQLRWAVRAAVVGTSRPPADAHLLAEITRPAKQTTVSAAMITDLRRTRLNLGDAVDRLGAAERRLATLEAGLARAQVEIDTLRNITLKGASLTESQDAREAFGFAIHFDLATFDGPYVLS